MAWFDPGDLIVPIGIHDRVVQEDGRGAALWLLGLHEDGAAIGFQARSLVDRSPGPYDPTPPELDHPRMTVQHGDDVASIPALRGKVHSVDGRLFKLDGVYFVRVTDRVAPMRCSIVIHGVELSLAFKVDDLGPSTR